MMRTACDSCSCSWAYLTAFSSPSRSNSTGRRREDTVTHRRATGRAEMEAVEASRYLPGGFHMRLVRMTTRRWLAAVAVVGIALAGSGELRRRSQAFKSRAASHAEEIFGIEDEIPPDNDWERFWITTATVEPHKPRKFYPPGWSPPSESDPPEIVAWRKSQKLRLTYHEMMYNKYERASRYPWLPLAPDPSPPGEEN
jgi:hypothetical protein